MASSAGIEQEELFRQLLHSAASLTPKQRLSMIAILLDGASLETILRIKSLVDESADTLRLQDAQREHSMYRYAIEVQSQAQKGKNYLYIRRYLPGLSKDSEVKFMMALPFAPGKDYLTEAGERFRVIRFRPLGQVSWDESTCLLDLQFFTPNGELEFKSLNFPECLEKNFQGKEFSEIVESHTTEATEFNITKGQINHCTSNMRAIASLSELIVGQIWEVRNIKRNRMYVLSFQGQPVVKVDRSNEKLIITTDPELLLLDIKKLCSSVLALKTEAIHFNVLASDFYQRAGNPQNQDNQEAVFSLFSF
jgi:hypothetical protein